MRILLLSSLFPNAVQPRKGQFVRERMRQMQQRYDIEWQVVAPVPWFPFANASFRSYAEFARVPPEENFEGDHLLHPRYAAIPKIGDALTPLAYAASAARCIARHNLEFDAIDAHFFFPDGVAAVLLGQRLKKPVVITARGSDIHFMPDEAAAGRWIRWAARRADRLVGVSQPLAERLGELSDGGAVLAAPNGVDTARFRPANYHAFRQRKGVEGFVVLSVGNLLELKGHHLAIDAIAGIPEATLLIVGEGPRRRQLEQLASAWGVKDRVRFLGGMPQDELVDCYSAADVLVLASSSEGSPNVVLEALSCGTPVISTVEHAVPPGPSARDVTHVERSAMAIRKSLQNMSRLPAIREEVRERALSLGWADTCDLLHVLYRSLHEARAGEFA
ncbi:MAG: glycosyltransferase [Woeseia sp.]